MTKKARRVLVPVSTPLSYAVVAPILRGLVAAGDVEVIVAARHGGEPLARQCLDVPFTWRSQLAARFTPFDVALCPGFFFRGFFGGRLVQTFHGVSPKNYAVAKDVLRFDRAFVIGPYHRAKFERAGLIPAGDPRAVEVGMPKTDPLLVAATPAERAALCARLDLDPALPIVAYAPTRSGSHGSTIDEIGHELIAALAALPVNVVVKLHDRSQRVFRRGLSVDHAGRIDALRQGSRVRRFLGHDVIPLLRHAEVLVSDLSSVAGEYLLRDRPIVFVNTDRHEKKIKKSGARKFGADDPHDLEWFRLAGETVAAPEEVRAAVERALSDPSDRSDERRARARILFYNPGAASAVAVHETRKLFDLEPKRA